LNSFINKEKEKKKAFVKIKHKRKKAGCEDCNSKMKR